MRKCLVFSLLLFGCLQASVDYLKDRVSSIASSMEGFCSKEKAENFIDLVFEVEPKLCVEIGTYAGASVFPVAASLKFLGKGTVIAIDAWDSEVAVKGLNPLRDKVEYRQWKGGDYQRAFEAHRSSIDRYGLSDFCITVRAPSKIAAICCNDIDILHIDGNLGETGTIEDIIDYLPRVREGGYIWIGDASKHRRERPVDLLRESCELVKTIDGGSTLLFKKRGN